MKITESKLRSIVKEILSKIQEERVEIDEEYELAEDLFDEMQAAPKRGPKSEFYKYTRRGQTRAANKGEMKAGRKRERQSGKKDVEDRQKDELDEMQSGGKRGAKATAPRIRDPRPDEKRKARKDTRKAGKKDIEKQKDDLDEMQSAPKRGPKSEFYKDLGRGKKREAPPFYKRQGNKQDRKAGKKDIEKQKDDLDEMQSGGKQGAKATAPRIRDPRPDEKRKARRDTRRAGKKEAEKQKDEG